jgi:hypothetical protein
MSTNAIVQAARQERAAIALASGKCLWEAAGEAGISIRTLRA